MTRFPLRLSLSPYTTLILTNYCDRPSKSTKPRNFQGDDVFPKSQEIIENTPYDEDDKVDQEGYDIIVT